MKDFSNTLLHRLVFLNNASDIVRFSFIVHKSISYLDLQLCHKLMVFNSEGILCQRCALERSNYFINTEEKCRKYFTPSRSLLYKLHLDLPKGREWSLAQCTEYAISRYSDVPHIAKINSTCGFYPKILSHFIQEIIDFNSKKLDILKWLLNISFLEKSLLYYLQIHTAKKFIDVFYPTITAPKLFKNFIMHLDIIEWLISYEDPEILEFLLYNARHFGRTDLLEEEDFSDIIDICILAHLFRNISPILKCMDSLKIPTCEYRHYPSEILAVRQDLNIEEFNKAEKRMKEERMHLIMQLIWMYVKGNLYHSVEVTLETLRLIWCSVSNPYISFNEIEKIFKGVFSAEELENIYDFYARAIGEFYEIIEPRTLQHLCRTVIRRTLRENQHWIPEGIKQMGLSNLIQSFLNLEKFVTRKEFEL